MAISRVSEMVTTEVSDEGREKRPERFSGTRLATEPRISAMDGSMEAYENAYPSWLW